MDTEADRLRGSQLSFTEDAGRALSARLVALWLIIGGIIMLIAGAGYATYRTFNAERQAREQVALTQSILAALRNVERAVVDAETGQRGFLLSQDSEYLATYQSGRKRLPDALSRLEDLLADVATPSQREQAAQLRELSEAKLEELARSISLVLDDELSLALALVQTDTGKDLMDRVRARITGLEAEEEQILARAVDRVSDIERQTLWALVLLGLGALAGAGGAGYLVWRSTKLEAAYQSALIQKAARDAMADAFDGQQAAVWVLDSGCTIRQANGEAQRISGMKREKLLGARLRTGVPWDEASAQTVDEACSDAALGEGRRIEVRFRHGDDVRVADLALSPRSNGDVIATAFDVTERDRAEERVKLVMGEVEHRVKNLFSLVPGLISMSARNAKDVDSLQRTVRERVSALARAHSLTLGLIARQHGMPVRSLIQAIVAPYDDERSRFTLEGPAVSLPSRMANSLGLALHELTTNAMKYGSLSKEGGRVTVEWRIEETDGPPMLHIEWRETGGPAVAAPSREGFGTKLIDRLLEADNGSITRHWSGAGFGADVFVPLNAQA